jgi:hypothetical protein
MRRQRATSGPPSNYHGKAPFGLFTIPPGSQTLDDFFLQLFLYF